MQKDLFQKTISAWFCSSFRQKRCLMRIGFWTAFIFSCIQINKTAWMITYIFMNNNVTYCIEVLLLQVPQKLRSKCASFKRHKTALKTTLLKTWRCRMAPTWHNVWDFEEFGEGKLLPCTTTEQTEWVNEWLVTNQATGLTSRIKPAKSPLGRWPWWGTCPRVWRGLRGTWWKFQMRSNLSWGRGGVQHGLVKTKKDNRSEKPQMNSERR